MMIYTQEQLEQLIAQWGFVPFFRNGVEGFSIEDVMPAERLFGGLDNPGAWEWKSPIIANWQAAYGKFFGGKAGYVSLEWLPDFINARRRAHPLSALGPDAKHILQVLRQHESLLSKQLKLASGFTLSRKRLKLDVDGHAVVDRRNGTSFDATIAQLQMGTWVCIAAFEYQISKAGQPYGWGVARYCTPEAMYPAMADYKSLVAGRTPKQSRQRILAHIASLFPQATARQLEKVI